MAVIRRPSPVTKKVALAVRSSPTPQQRGQRAAMRRVGISGSHRFSGRARLLGGGIGLGHRGDLLVRRVARHLADHQKLSSPAALRGLNSCARLPPSRHRHRRQPCRPRRSGIFSYAHWCWYEEHPARHVVQIERWRELLHHELLPDADQTPRARRPERSGSGRRCWQLSVLLDDVAQQIGDSLLVGHGNFPMSRPPRSLEEDEAPSPSLACPGDRHRGRRDAPASHRHCPQAGVHLLRITTARCAD